MGNYTLLCSNIINTWYSRRYLRHLMFLHKRTRTKKLIFEIKPEELTQTFQRPSCRHHTTFHLGIPLFFFRLANLSAIYKPNLGCCIFFSLSKMFCNQNGPVSFTMQSRVYYLEHIDVYSTPNLRNWPKKNLWDINILWSWEESDANWRKLRANNMSNTTSSELLIE